MGWDDCVQLSENIQYPEGFNAVTIEGTGDEGGIEMFGLVSLTVTPTRVISDGVQTMSCLAIISDPNDPDAGEVTLQTETISASSPWEISPGMSIIKQGTTNPWGVRLWYNVGNDVKGTELVGWIDKIVNDVIYTNQPLVQVSVIVEYYGANTVEFDTSNPLLERQNAGDPDWQLDTIDGKFEPEIATITSNQATCTFKPSAGQSGTGYITAKYKGNFATVEILVDPGAGAYEITIEADPPSIEVGETTKVTAYVTENGRPVTSGTTYFSIWTGNDKASISTRSAEMTTDQKTEIIHSSYDFDANQAYISVGYPIIDLQEVSVEVDGSVTVYTSSATLDPDDNQRINMSPSFDYQDVVVRVVYTTGGFATTTVQGYETTIDVYGKDTPVQIRAVYGGRDKLYDLTITDPIQSTNLPDMQVLQSSDSCNWGRATGYTVDLTAVVSGYGDNPALETLDGSKQKVYFEITYPDASETNRGIVSYAVMDTEESPVMRVEALTPSEDADGDYTILNVTYPITRINRILYNGTPLSTNIYSWTFAGKAIRLSQGLPTNADSSVEVEYWFGGVCNNVYLASANSWSGKVDVTVTTSVDYQVAEEGELVTKTETITKTLSIQVGGGVATGDPQLSVTADTEAVAHGGQGVQSYERRVRFLVSMDDSSDRPLLGEPVTVEFMSRSGGMPSYGTLVGVSSNKVWTGTMDNDNGIKPTSQDPATAQPDWHFNEMCSVTVQQNTEGHGTGYPPTYQDESKIGTSKGVLEVLDVKKYYDPYEAYAGETVAIGREIFLNPALVVPNVYVAYKFSGAVVEYYAPNVECDGTVTIQFTHYGGYDPANADRYDPYRKQTQQFTITVGRGELPPWGPLDDQPSINPMRSTLQNPRIGRQDYETTTPVLITLNDKDGYPLVGSAVTISTTGGGSDDSGGSVTMTTLERRGQPPVDPDPATELPPWEYWEESSISWNAGISEIALQYSPVEAPTQEDSIFSIKTHNGTDFVSYNGNFSVEGKVIRLAQTFPTGTKCAVEYDFCGGTFTYTAGTNCVGHIIAQHDLVQVDAYITCGHGEDVEYCASLTMTAMRTVLKPALTGVLDYEKSTPALCVLEGSWGNPWPGTVAVEKTCGSGSPDSVNVTMGSVPRAEERADNVDPEEEKAPWRYLEVISANANNLRELTTSYPIKSIQSIVHETTEITSFSFEGKTILCEDPLPDISGTKVEYTFGGGEFTITAPNREWDGITHFKGTFARGDGKNDLIAGLDITMGNGDSTGNGALTLEANPTHVKHGPDGENNVKTEDRQSKVTIIKENPFGKPGTGSVSLELIPNGHGSLSSSTVSMGTCPDEKVEMIAPDDTLTKLTTSLPIVSITSIKTNAGTGGSVSGSFLGKEISLAQKLDNGSDCEVTYRWGGWGEVTYTAPNTADADADVWIEGTTSTGVGAEEDFLRNGCEIIVGDGSGGGTPDISIGADWNADAQEFYPTTIKTGGTAKLRVEVVTGDGSPMKNVGVKLSISGESADEIDPATGRSTKVSKAPIGSISTTTGTTDADGFFRFTYNAGSKTGVDVVEAAIADDPSNNASTNVTVSWIGNSPGKNTYTFYYGSFKGKLNPWASTLTGQPGEGGGASLSGAETGDISLDVDSAGAGDDCDTSYGISYNPQDNPAIIHIQGFGLRIPVPYKTLRWIISSSGGVWVRNSSGDNWGTEEVWQANQEKAAQYGSADMDLGGGYSYYILVPWASTNNTNQQQYQIGISGVDGGKLQGAKVSIQGQTATTDAGGTATFKDLPAGTWPVDITADGYYSNREPDYDEAKVTASWDTDGRNDYVTVPDHTREPFVIQSVELTIEVQLEVTTDFYYAGPMLIT